LLAKKTEGYSGADLKAVLDVAVEATGMPAKELRRLLDPAALTRGGIQG